MAEGSVWEAANAALHLRLDNLCVVIDANALGQSQATQFAHDTQAIADRWEGFGWAQLQISTPQCTTSACRTGEPSSIPPYTRRLDCGARACAALMPTFWWTAR
jgi:hypothetical protein